MKHSIGDVFVHKPFEDSGPMIWREIYKIENGKYYTRWFDNKTSTDESFTDEDFECNNFYLERNYMKRKQFNKEMQDILDEKN